MGILLSAALLLGAVQDKTEGSLPDAKGKATLQRVCSGCHDLDVVTASRFTQSRWEQKAMT
jgi:cytochrome c5